MLRRQIKMQYSIKQCPFKRWRSRDLNPGLSACEADTLPLSYTPSRRDVSLIESSKGILLTFHIFTVAVIASCRSLVDLSKVGRRASARGLRGMETALHYCFATRKVTTDSSLLSSAPAGKCWNWPRPGAKSKSKSKASRRNNFVIVQMASKNSPSH